MYLSVFSQGVLTNSAFFIFDLIKFETFIYIFLIKLLCQLGLLQSKRKAFDIFFSCNNVIFFTCHHFHNNMNQIGKYIKENVPFNPTLVRWRRRSFLTNPADPNQQ